MGRVQPNFRVAREIGGLVYSVGMPGRTRKRKSVSLHPDTHCFVNAMVEDGSADNFSDALDLCVLAAREANGQKVTPAAESSDDVHQEDSAAPLRTVTTSPDTDPTLKWSAPTPATAVPDANDDDADSGPADTQPSDQAAAPDPADLAWDSLSD